jgi:SET domain-containing protein
MSRHKVSRIILQCSPYLLSIRPSKIDRYGVFAGKTIPPRHKVMTYGGEKIPMAGAVKRAVVLMRKGSRSRTFLAAVNRKWAIDGSIGGNGAERINHCCDPNVSFRRGHGTLLIYSRRKIRKGEELTLHYAFREKDVKIPCRCGSPKCRGYMNKRLRGDKAQVRA